MNIAIGIVLVLGVIILVHEWGHFIIARLFGVRVDVFSIGFGPRLFGFKWGQTDWRISAVPLGGYVRMAGQDITDIDSNDQKPTGAPDELMSKPRWQRALITFAGPAVNLIFPVLLLGAYYLSAGVPYAAFLNKPIVVAEPPAQLATDPNALQTGDRVVSVNSLKNPTWEQVQSLLGHIAPGTSLNVQVENNGVTRTVEVPLKSDPSSRPFGYYPIPARISEVAQGTPASHAGLRSGDTVLSIDGQKITYWDQFVDIVRGSGGKTLQLEVQRNGQTLTLPVTPKQGISDTADNKYQIALLPSPLSLTSVSDSPSPSRKQAPILTKLWKIPSASSANSSAAAFPSSNCKASWEFREPLAKPFRKAPSPSSRLWRSSASTSAS